MKKIYKIVLLVCVVFMSCEKSSDNNANTIENLDSKVKSILGDKVTAAELKDFHKKEWKCTTWDVNFYNGDEKVGTWNSFDKTMKTLEKSQTYRFYNNKFTVLSVNSTLKSSTPSLPESFSYDWNEKGEISINGVKIYLRMLDSSLVMLFNTKDLNKVGSLFNVTVDNAFGNIISEGSDMEGMVVSRFRKNNPLEGNSILNMTAQNMVEAFINNENIQNSKYLDIKRKDNNVFILSMGTGASVAVRLNTSGQLSLSNSRAQKIFDALIYGGVFNVLGEDVRVQSIFYDNPESKVLKVDALTSIGQYVTFRYNLESDKQEWVIAPQEVESMEMSSYDLVQKFHDRTAINDHVYNSLEITTINNCFMLVDSLAGKLLKVSLDNNSVDLANVTPERAIGLFYKFMKNDFYVFKDYKVKIFRITHENGSGGNFLVYGRTEAGEFVKFYIDTKSDKQHWLVSPQNVIDINLESYDLVKKYLDRAHIYNQVFNTIAKTNVENVYELSGAGGVSVKVSIQNNQIDLANITPERAKVLFNAFLRGEYYIFKDVKVMINKISHEDGSGDSFLVYGITDTNKTVKIYFNTRTNKEHWLISPEG